MGWRWVIFLGKKVDAPVTFFSEVPFFAARSQVGPARVLRFLQVQKITEGNALSQNSKFWVVIWQDRAPKISPRRFFDFAPPPSPKNVRPLILEYVDRKKSRFF